MKLSEELNYRIRYDVEHDLFHAQNVFNDEYITPTFIEYVQKLEKENTELERKLEQTEKDLADYQFNYPTIKDLEKENAELKETLKTYNGCGDWDNDFHTCRVYLQHEELQELQIENAGLKEELKDEMKNRISLALKDPILQQGFEIICKENAELKTLIKSEHEIEARKNNGLIAQLTTAKGLLAKWVELYTPKLEGFPKTPIQIDTEQFLNSEVEK